MNARVGYIEYKEFISRWGGVNEMWRNLGRRLKFEYLKLIRSNGAASKIALSFALGMFIEFITLPTVGLAFLLLYPLVRLCKGLFSVSLIGFALGKLLVPVFLVLNYKVGSFLLQSKQAMLHTVKGQSFFSLESLSQNGLVFLSGSAFNGLLVATVCYGLVYLVLAMYRKQKEVRRFERQTSPME